MWNYGISHVVKAGTALVLVAGMAGTGISSAEAKPTADLVNSINITGVATDVASETTSTITGTATITGIEFDPVTNALQFTGTISGLATDNGITTEILSQVFSTSGTIVGDTSGKGKCAILNLDLGPLDLDLLGLTVDLSEVELDIAAVRGPGKLLGNLLCQLTRLLDSPADIINRQLTRINSIIGTGLENVAVTGVLPEGGTFTGFLTLDSLAVDNDGNLVISALLNGIATGNGLTTTVLNQTFTTTGTLDGSNSSGKGKKCEILTLDLGPINLDLLGLQVDLSEVMLDLGATTGSGKLLGNLLCGLTRALDADDKGKPEKKISKLNKAVQKINQQLLN